MKISIQKILAFIFPVCYYLTYVKGIERDSSLWNPTGSDCHRLRADAGGTKEDNTPELTIRSYFMNRYREIT